VAQLQRAAPPYAQVAQHIRDQIHAGDLRPGDRVPSVRELSAEWGISRATADKALSALRSEGLVVAVTGVGTVVAPQLPTVQTGGNRFRRMLTTGRATRAGERSEILSSDLVDGPDDVLRALLVKDNPRVVRRRRRFIDEDGTVVAISTSWLPASAARAVPALLTTDPIPGGTIGALREATGRQPAQGNDTATARLATDEEAADLGLDQPVAVLVVEARLADEDGEMIEYGVDVIRPGRSWAVGYDLSLV
jgi:DNA-binding GntR family transcriptional regulator